MNTKFQESREYIAEINSLKSKLFVAKIFATMMTCMCCIFGVILMTNNNKLVDENIALTRSYEKQIQQQTDYYAALETNYEFLVDSYDSFNNTIDELTTIAQVLDEQNQSLVQSNQEYYEELEKFRQREELYDKYEYSLYVGRTRTDITYDQLLFLEDLLKDSTINDQDLILSWIMTESGGKEDARNSESTAKGYGQFLDGTSKFVYTSLLNRDDWNPNVALDGYINLEMMITYIDYLYEVNDGDLYEIMKDYRGKRDITNYIAKIDSYLANVDKSVHDIYLVSSKK